MAKRHVVWSLCGLLLVILAAGGLGCKQEEGESSQGEAFQNQMTAPENKRSAEEEARRDTVLFEEEEGVQQEDETQQDY